MSRRPASPILAAWALVAHLGMVLLSAPCACAVALPEAAEATVCCCGPGAETPCHAPSGDESRSQHSCVGELGPSCAASPDEALAPEAPSATGDALPVPGPVAVLSVALPEPLLQLRLRQRSRAPSPPPLRLDQVRSTVLLT